MEVAPIPEQPIAEDPGRSRTPGRRRRLRRLFWIFISFVGIVVVVVFLVVPWLGRRGNLNSLVAGLISSALEIPVDIGTVESEPLGRLTLTRLRSVSAETSGKLRFSAE